MNRSRAVAVLVVSVCTLTAGGAARAQQPIADPGADVLGMRGRNAVAATAAPLFDPGVNYYLNPYLAGGYIPPDAALLSILAAQRRSGGIGSGELSGVRQAQRGRPMGQPNAQAPRSRMAAGQGADSYYRRSGARPGGSASSYFQRYDGRFDR